jgi:hypothetical protein
MEVVTAASTIHPNVAAILVKLHAVHQILRISKGYVPDEDAQIVLEKDHVPVQKQQIKEEVEEQHHGPEYVDGEVVWVSQGGWGWWPAMYDANESRPDEGAGGKFVCEYFASQGDCEVTKTKICPFLPHFSQVYNERFSLIFLWFTTNLAFPSDIYFRWHTSLRYAIPRVVPHRPCTRDQLSLL